MTILRDISLVWALIHVLILFIFFYESRFSRKKTVILTFLLMIPLGALNIVGVILYGPELMGQLLILTCTLPSGIFFFLIAKDRNWKFLFTFCVVDTLSYEIIVVSKLLDHYIFGDRYIAMLVIRLLAFPLMEWVAYRYIRKPFLDMKATLRSGWGIFTGVTVIYYVLLWLAVNFPTIVVERPSYIPLVVLVMLLMPVTYVGIFLTLRNQMRLVNAESRERLLEVQASALEQKIEEVGRLEEALRIQRHDARHRYSVINELIRSGNVAEAIRYIDETETLLDSTREPIYCTDPVINAVFAYFVRKAHQSGIETDIHVSIPPDIGLQVTELSVVIANAFENAINACMALPPENRAIKCDSVHTPQFIFRMSNPFEGKLVFGEDGLPRTDRDGHGTGIHSITAFCDKYDVYYEFAVEDGSFVFRMAK